MNATFCTTRRVDFRDTDAAGIMHFSVFFTVMESVETEFLRTRGLTVMSSDAAGQLGWPRVSAKCEYVSPLRFEDEFQIALRITRIGQKSVTFAFDFSLAGRPVATGEMTSVCCRIADDGTPTSIPIPEGIVRRLRGEIGAG
jgi:4-hydroxybenzoyl-CoA thioesterase/acyl-CoA thioester hydrolase